MALAAGQDAPAAGDGAPDVVLMATGSEVQLAVKARELLAADGAYARLYNAQFAAATATVG